MSDYGELMFRSRDCKGTQGRSPSREGRGEFVGA